MEAGGSLYRDINRCVSLPDLSYTVTVYLRERVALHSKDGTSDCSRSACKGVEWVSLGTAKALAEPGYQQEWYREGEQPVVS
ncbi:hypothetical protein [Paenibacillus sp. P46E]|uniref:hypothetical protein n=1 Tax=Paenibacillus sp. P46E TaxID=1349436 RepID=UPI001160E5F6|nr:hypothetical protein [Paenibacillus sp. P46E]